MRRLCQAQGDTLGTVGTGCPPYRYWYFLGGADCAAFLYRSTPGTTLTGIPAYLHTR